MSFSVPLYDGAHRWSSVDYHRQQANFDWDQAVRLFFDEPENAECDDVMVRMFFDEPPRFCNLYLDNVISDQLRAWIADGLVELLQCHYMLQKYISQ